MNPREVIASRQLMSNLDLPGSYVRSSRDWSHQFGRFVPGLISAIELSFDGKNLILLRKRLADIFVSRNAVSVLTIWNCAVEIAPSLL